MLLQRFRVTFDVIVNVSSLSLLSFDTLQCLWLAVVVHLIV